MALQLVREQLINNNWREEALDCLPDYSLYRGIEGLFTYKNILALQYHAGSIILTVSPPVNSARRTMQGHITRTVWPDSVGIKVAYNDNLEAILKKLISKQDDITVEQGYITISMLFNPVASATILALEQFLNKDIYLNEPKIAESEKALLDKSNAFCQQKQFDQSHNLLMDHVANQGVMNVHLFYNLYYTSTTPNLPGVVMTPERTTSLIQASRKFLDSLTYIDSDHRAYVFFISRTTYLMIGLKQFAESIDVIREYAALGGEINADVLLNYSYCASELNDAALKKEILAEMIQLYEKDPQILSHKNKSFLYMADNIATLAASVGDKENTLHYLKIARDLDPEFQKNKTSEYYTIFHNDPDFLALFEQSSSNQNDPVIFPGQPVAKLSDYVRILKGMQSGNMGILSEYGLDIMQYSSVAQAWALKLMDPTISARFSTLMAELK